MQQYFIDRELFQNESVKLDKEVLHHLKKVLRKKDSYKMRLVDINHEVFLAELKNDEALVIQKLDEDRELPFDLTLAMALIKHDRFEWAIQKATELGVKRIIPLITERVVINDKSEVKRLERYRRIAKEASEQSLRSYIPKIDNFMSLDEVIALDIKNKYIAYEKESAMIHDEFKADTLIVIGPEGGFSEKEFNLLVEKDFKSISLGKRILRAETAAICAISLIARGME